MTVADQILEHYSEFTKSQQAVVGHGDDPLLVIAGTGTGKTHCIVLRALNLLLIWKDLPQWPYVEKERLAAQTFDLRERMQAKKSYGVTGDLTIYETCSRQYQFFRECAFTPSRSAVNFFGLLVHQSVKDIHRIAIDGKLHTLNKQLFERTFGFLCLSEARPIGEVAKEATFRQVLSYFKQNQNEMRRVIEIGADVSLEKGDYILVGKVDLLLGGDGNLELLDFKTSWSNTADFGWIGCCYTGLLKNAKRTH